MNGYYTTEELYKKNIDLGFEIPIDFEIIEKSKDSLKSARTTSSSIQFKSDLKDNKLLSVSTLPAIKEHENDNAIIIENSSSILDNTNKNQGENQINNKSNSSILIPENPLPKNERKDFLSKSVKPDVSANKKKSYGFDKKNIHDSRKAHLTRYSEYIKLFQMLSYYITNQENSKEKKVAFEKDIEALKENLEKYKRKLRILEMNKQIEFLKKKKEAINDLTKDLEEAIKHKKENLENVTNKLKPIQINYSNKLNQLKNNLNSRGQHQLVYDSFVYQKMAEVCFVFFNNKIQSLYTIPKFYNEPISNDSKKMERLDYYNSDKKNISAMMGHICQLMIYLSKTFNIPLRFPIFLNGSRSYILRSVKDKMFLPLYLDAKKDDKHGNFENALNCLKDDIKEIFNFLSMFPEIVSKQDNENVNNMNGKYLFFFFFVVFNHSLFRFMKTLQTAI